MNGRIAISSLATALLMGAATIALADNGTPAGTTAAHAVVGMGNWACSEGSTVSSAASSGPAAGIGVPNDQTGRETSSPEFASVAPSAATDTVTTVGRSTPGKGLDEATLRRQLGDQGYLGVADVRCIHGAWTFRGIQNGASMDMRMNPQTGALESR